MNGVVSSPGVITPLKQQVRLKPVGPIESLGLQVDTRRGLEVHVPRDLMQRGEGETLGYLQEHKEKACSTVCSLNINDQQLIIKRERERERERERGRAREIAREGEVE